LIGSAIVRAGKPKRGQSMKRELVDDPEVDARVAAFLKRMMPH
jgi:hypothetical protein